jgi:hypothetical protein
MVPKHSLLDHGPTELQHDNADRLSGGLLRAFAQVLHHHLVVALPLADLHERYPMPRL